MSFWENESVKHPRPRFFISGAPITLSFTFINCGGFVLARWSPSFIFIFMFSFMECKWVWCSCTTFSQLYFDPWSQTALSARRSRWQGIAVPDWPTSALRLLCLRLRLSQHQHTSDRLPSQAAATPKPLLAPACVPSPLPRTGLYTNGNPHL